MVVSERKSSAFRPDGCQAEVAVTSEALVGELEHSKAVLLDGRQDDVAVALEALVSKLARYHIA